MEKNPFASFGAHLSGFLRFDAAAFADLQNDPNAPVQALAVVAVASLAAAVGAAAGDLNPGTLQAAFIGELGQWAACAAFAFFFGITLFAQAKSTSFMATLPLFGFAQAPKAVGALGVIPAIGPIAGMIGIVLFLVYIVAALRFALGFDVVRAVANALAGFFLAYAMFAGAFVSGGFDAAAFGSARPLAAHLPMPVHATPPPVQLGIGRARPEGAVAPQPPPKPAKSGRHPRHARVERATPAPVAATAAPAKTKQPKEGAALRVKGTPKAKQTHPDR